MMREKHIVFLFFSIFAAFLGCSLDTLGGGEFTTEPNSPDVVDSGSESSPDSGDWPEVGSEAEPDAPHDSHAEPSPDAAPDVQVDAPKDVHNEADASPDAPPDVVEADAPVDVQLDVVADVVDEDVNVVDAPPTFCETHGTPGIITIVSSFNINPSDSFAQWGKITYLVPDPGAGAVNIPWSGLCWAQPGETSFVCEPHRANGDPMPALSGTVVEFQPQRTPGVGQNPYNSLCEADICPYTTDVLCGGTVEVCRTTPSTPASSPYYVDPDGDHEPNKRCTIP